MPVGAVGAGFNNTPSISDAKEAAGALEALLFKQLMKNMTESVGKSGLFGDGFQADMYQDMYASTIAEQASGSGLGVSSMIERALGVEDRESVSKSTSLSGIAGAVGAYRAVAQKTEAPPANVPLYKVVTSFVDDAGAARWGKDGTLTTGDLGANLTTSEADGVAAFNVNDASGYQGFPKCNLFAFETVRRSGHTVPVVGRSHGWGYMGADAATNLASQGKVDSWAAVRTHDTKEQLDGAAYAGVPLLLASSGSGDKVGHMAVADRIHSVKRNGEGEIVALEYSGWEATTNGASYGRRMWRTEGVQGNGRGGLGRIEIMEPHQNDGSKEVYVTVGGNRPGASVLDKP